MPQSLLLIGLKSTVVDFQKWPQLSAEKLENAFAEICADLTEAGFDAR